MREDLSELLQGFSANRLTEDGKRMLADAAMADQDVFDAILEEQIVKDLTEHPDSLQTLAMDTAAPAAERRSRRWLSKLKGFLGFSVPSPQLEPAVGFSSANDIATTSVFETVIMEVAGDDITITLPTNPGLAAGSALQIFAASDNELLGVLFLQIVGSKLAKGRFHASSSRTVAPGDRALWSATSLDE